jgi:hypothetical protein
VIVGVFVAAVTLLFAAGWVGTGQQAALGITESRPDRGLFQIGTWLPFQGNMLLLPIMALCDMAILVYFLRPENRDGFHWFKTLVAPIIGAGSISFAVYLMMQNRGALTTGSRTRVGVRRPVLRARDLPGRVRARRHLLHLVAEAIRRRGQVHPRGGLTTA